MFLIWNLLKCKKKKKKIGPRLLIAAMHRDIVAKVNRSVGSHRAGLEIIGRLSRPINACVAA